MSTSVGIEKLYTTEAAARVIGVDASTLRRWRTAHPPQGPAFIPVTGRVTRYRPSDVEAWMLARRVDPAEAA